MYYAFVPSLFDAIQAGKPAKILRRPAPNGTLLRAPSTIGFTPLPRETLHSHSLLFRMKVMGAVEGEAVEGDAVEADAVEEVSYGAVATIIAELGPLPTPSPNTTTCDGFCAAHHYLPDACHCGVCGSFGECTFSCKSGAGRVKCPIVPHPPPPPPPMPPPGKVKRAIVLSPDGTISYSAASATDGLSMSANVANGAWHEIALMHYWCNGSTGLYVDGVLVSRTTERLAPSSIALTPAKTTGGVKYGELMIYRAALSPEELAATTNASSAVVLDDQRQLSGGLAGEPRGLRES